MAKSSTFDRKPTAKHESPFELPEIAVHVAFFIPEWEDVLNYIQGLRAAHLSVGPLEWSQLHQLDWLEYHIWPQLDLTRWNEATKLHLEGIAKYYSKVNVNETTSLAWVRQCVHPKAAISWIGIYNAVQTDASLWSEWSRFRITSVDVTYLPENFDQSFCHEHLEILRVYNCTVTAALSAFKFAASMRTITATMTDFLLKWIFANPVRIFVMDAFSWVDRFTRQQVMSALFCKSTLEYFRFVETDASNLIFRGQYDGRDQWLSLEFRDPGHFGDLHLEMESIHAFFSLFRPLFPEKIKTLYLVGLEIVGFRSAWPILIELLLVSKLETLEIDHENLPMEDAIRLAEAVCQHVFLQELILRRGTLSFINSGRLRALPPPSLKDMDISTTTLEHTRLFIQIETNR
ncbi:hypothetical protein AeNC1_015751 [Aphanomyces euteiches]|nr:hypothetical protein AeNC1_015751 [Aphanomyces euteiches]